MPFAINVNIAGSSPLEFDLPDGRYRIGSRPECEIHIENSEVTGVAAQMDVRGEAVFIRNMNPFPIYVGEYELSSSQQAEWPQGHTVLLTQSVSLELFDVKGKSEQTTAQEKAKRSRSTIQIAVTALCLGLGLFLLLSDSTPVDSTNSLRYSFTDLVEDLRADKTGKYEGVLNYLIDARVSDVRWGNENPRRAISAYQLLLDEPLVRDSVASDETPQGRIRQFALARVDDLSGLLAPN